MDIVLKKPIISEKSMRLASKGMFTFIVDKNARKPLITHAIENKFGVNVVAIKTVNFKEQLKLQRNRRGYFAIPEFKKAIVQLKSGQKIALFEAEKEEAPKEEVKEKKSLLKGTKVKIERTEKVDAKKGKKA